MKIQYYIKQVYGVDSRYVADKGVAGCITALTGKKTISEGDIKALTTLGFTFEQVLAVKA